MSPQYTELTCRPQLKRLLLKIFHAGYPLLLTSFLPIFLIIHCGIFLGSDLRANEFNTRPSADLQNTNLKHWTRAIQGFREGHHLGFHLGVSQSNWQYEHFSTQDKKTHHSTGGITKLTYTYHIQIYRGLGYFLGSSAAGIKETSHDHQMTINSQMLLPGILLGIAYNFSALSRLNLATEYQLERWSNLGERDSIDEDPSISVSARSLSFIASYDLFLNIQWSINLLIQKSYATHDRQLLLGERETQVVINKITESYAAGLSYQIF